MNKQRLITLPMTGLAAGLPLLFSGDSDCQARQGKKNDRSPNIVIILADDLGYGDIGCHGSVILTPNIDRIFNQGVELTRHYAAPVSSPTRCGLMTGRYPSRFGIRETVIPPWREYGLPENEETMADVLGQNGYGNRAIIGKWHLGHGRKAFYPLNRGFTHFYGCLNGAIEYFTHFRDGELDWHNDWESCRDEGYSTDLIAAESARCIKEYSKGSPYLVYCAFNAPHAPYEVPEDELYSMISKEEFENLPKKDQKGWTYRAMVSRMDKGVGKILDAIEASGEKDNTIVVFMSDNGGCPGMEPYCTNKPLRGNKFLEFEGGVRVSCAVWWENGNVKGGRKIDEVTAFVDFVPTFKSILKDRKTPANPYDGIDITSLLNGKTDRIDRTVYLGVGAAVNRQWKMILAGRNQGMKLKEDMFIDIEKDPSEKLPYDGYIDKSAGKALREMILEYDAIKPYYEEIPYGQGKDGFKAPFEWIVTKD